MTQNEGAFRKGYSQRADSRQDLRLDWWREERFGMFIHWGLYAIPAGKWKGEQIPGIGEWIMHRARIPVLEYEPLVAEFNPVQFDAAQWVSLAKSAGQKHIVITAKHHDGFCMYHSKVTGYNIVDATPFERDPMTELADECQKQGLKFGFYYSQTQDWHHPDGDGNDWDYVETKKQFANYVEDYVKAQIRELLTQYGPISVMWFDTPKRLTAEQSQSLLDLCREVQPDCLVNGRLGNGLGDYAETKDNSIPEGTVDADWEMPGTINDTWGFKADDGNWKSSRELIQKLVDIASKGGNYLLNVGPTAEGLIPQPSAARLVSMGDWLKENGEAVYGTDPGPVQGLEWCRSTRKSDKIYLHVFDWPKGGTIKIPTIPFKFARANLLSDKSQTALPYKSQDDSVIICGPSAAPDATDTVIVLAGVD